MWWYTDPQCDLQSIGEVEDTCNVVSGPSDEAGNDESEEDKEENGVEAGSEENDLQVPLNGLPLSADGTGKTHSMATSLDGTLLKCAQCKEEQEVRAIESGHLCHISNRATPI